ncbi:MAG: STAS/SEC14 domain-containing protein [Bdellovibrionales bacterium]|nr:STAS/SEC14 domain-containing protein [Bdellovibrionales bacterium]
MFTIMQNLPAHILGIRAEDVVTAEDYEMILIPLLDEALRQGRKVRLLYQLSPKFARLTLGAAWDDLKVGLKYMMAFEKVAVVTDIGWIRDAARMFKPLIPCPVHDYANNQLDEAIAWLAGTEVSPQPEMNS